MRTTSVARTTTESIPREASSLGPAIHPGEILLEEFLKPLEMTQAAAAKTLGSLDCAPQRARAGQARGDRRHGAAAGAALQDDAAVLDAHAGQLRPEGGHGSPARAEAGQEVVAIWARRGAIGCKAPRHSWHLRQCWHCRLCNLQNPKAMTEFESHPLRHSKPLKIKRLVDPIF